MKTRMISISMLLFILILNACSPFTITSSSGPQPYQVVETIQPSGYQPVTVDQVEVEVGVGSPIPVHVHVSGNLPDICSQVEYTEIRQDGTNFIITLSATAVDEACLQDTLPFRMSIPLNIVNMPEGPYVVNVNGVTTGFDPHLVPAKNQEERKPIQVEHVGVRAGEGSPIPVEIVASGTWPVLCSQIAEVQSKVNGFEIDVTVLASTTSPCPPDQLGLPFRYAFPLNVVEMEAGTYTITVNGTSTTLDLPIGP